MSEKMLFFIPFKYVCVLECDVAKAELGGGKKKEQQSFSHTGPVKVLMCQDLY